MPDLQVDFWMSALGLKKDSEMAKPKEKGGMVFPEKEESSSIMQVRENTVYSKSSVFIYDHITGMKGRVVRGVIE